MQQIKLMDGLLHRITEGGKFTTYLFKLPDDTFGRVYVSPNYRNFHNWKDLKIGDLVSGLVWYDEVKRIFNGDSPVYKDGYVQGTKTLEYDSDEGESSAEPYTLVIDYSSNTDLR